MNLIIKLFIHLHLIIFIPESALRRRPLQRTLSEISVNFFEEHPLSAYGFICVTSAS